MNAPRTGSFSRAREKAGDAGASCAGTRREGRRRVLAAVLALACAAAQAQSVALQGTMGRKALVMVDGGAPKTLGPGESFQGVTLVSVSGDEAVVEVNGKRQTLRVGAAPASVGAGSGGPASGRGTRIVLPVDTGGHFVTQGAINGRSATLMVDTGATVVAIGAADAERMGLNYRQGKPAMMSTANGVAPAWQIRLDSIRIGDVEVNGVEAVVTPQPMPFVLLGNSFLNRFQMRRDSEMMVLERRY